MGLFSPSRLSDAASTSGLAIRFANFKSGAYLQCNNEAVMEAVAEGSGGHSSDILIYSDGACDPNPGRGGWGARIVHSDGICHELKWERARVDHQQPDGDDRRTNGPPCGHGSNRPVIVRSDSQYVIRTLRGQYRRYANLDLWKEIDREVTRFTPHSLRMGARARWRRSQRSRRQVGKCWGRASSSSARCSACFNCANSVAKRGVEARASPFALEMWQMQYPGQKTQTVSGSTSMSMRLHS